MKGRIPVKAIFEGFSHMGSLMPCEGPQHVLGILKSVREHVRRRLAPVRSFPDAIQPAKARRPVLQRARAAFTECIVESASFATSRRPTSIDSGETPGDGMPGTAVVNTIR